MLSETILKGTNILARSQVTCSRTNWLVKKEYLNSYQNIKKIMHKAFKPVYSSDSLWKVEEILTKNGFEDLIIVNKDLKPVGYLSVHKCFQHVLDYGFQNAVSMKVEQLMETTDDAIFESDPLGRAIDFFAEHEHRNFLPIINANKRMQGYLCRAKVFGLILKLKQVAWHTKVHKLSPG